VDGLGDRRLRLEVAVVEVEQFGIGVDEPVPFIAALV